MGNLAITPKQRGIFKVKEKPIDATHYSPSMDAYFHSDGALFVMTDEHGWIEYTEQVKDLIEV